MNDTKTHPVEEKLTSLIARANERREAYALAAGVVIPENATLKKVSSDFVFIASDLKEILTDIKPILNSFSKPVLEDNPSDQPFRVSHTSPLSAYLKSDQDLIVTPGEENIVFGATDLGQQKPPAEPLLKHKKQEDTVWLQRIFSWVKSQLKSVSSWLQISDPFYYDYPVFPGPRPRVYSILHIGQEFPKVYTPQVPPNTVLIAIDTKDWPECNCFLAQPVSLETLKKELQRDVSTNNI